MTETYDHFVQLDLEIFYQQFFWPALYATPGTPAYIETCFQYKQVNYVSWTYMFPRVFGDEFGDEFGDSLNLVINLVTNSVMNFVNH